tara:strand:+ start:1165 stop:1809 length:645 start_codon:yes stop_codon:yes gene_type:complete
MKQYILYFVIIVLLLYFAYNLYQHREGIQNKVTHIVLLGDSIFQNNNYVPKSKSVEYLLKEKLSIPSLVLAQDNAIIYDIPKQYNSMPLNLNAKTTNLYISIGGNDLLNLYEHNNTNNSKLFNMVWEIYKKTILMLIDSTQCNIILTDIYFISDPNYSKYIPMIKKWNSNLYQFADQHKLNVFKISKILTQPKDFTNSIEPSVIGGNKMVNSFI